MELESAFGRLVETRVRALTWNIWLRFGPWEERQAAIATVLAAEEPDIVALQEVWDDGTTNQAAVLADHLGYEHAYDARLELDGVLMGNAVLSRWPITGSESRDLPAIPERDERRFVLRADIDGPRGPIQLFTTHLNFRFDHSQVRQDQASAICRFVRDSGPREFPAILCGDLNADPESDEIRMLTGQAASPEPPVVFHDAWRVAGDGPGWTWCNDNPYAALDLEPDRRIDYVLAGWPKGEGRGHVLSAHLAGDAPVGGLHPSDHFAVVAGLR